MIKYSGLITFLLLLISHSTVQGQVEVARLSTKGYSAIGFGAFLNFAVPVSEGSSITAEAGFYSFKNDDDEGVLLVPLLVGYRYTFNKTSTGLYIEPMLGYSLGASDIAKYDENDALIPNATGDGWLEQQAKGPTAGVGTGYILQGSFPLNIGLRYQRVFVSKDPGLNMFSLRLSYPIRFGRRSE